MPYLLAQMNLLLHGLETPQIDYGNALRHKLSEIGEGQRVDIILTNPPFGGEEEKGIKDNFPSDKQTSETALLFLQLIMRKLRKFPVSGPGKHEKPARTAVVVPNGTLFADGVAARIKEDLLKEFNLHTIVRLPNGVFAPYTGIPTNLLFFDRSGPTRHIWYYELALPAGRKNFTKTQPMQFEDFADCIAWWHSRDSTEQAENPENPLAWRVPVEEVLQYNADRTLKSVNLDVTNPSAAQDAQHRTPEELVESILKKEARIAEIMQEIRAMIAQGPGVSQ